MIFVKFQKHQHPNQLKKSSKMKRQAKKHYSFQFIASQLILVVFRLSNKIMQKTTSKG